MFALLRTGLIAAAFCLAFSPSFTASPAFAAGPTYQSDQLDDAAVKLEAELKREAGTVSQPVASLEQQAQAALATNDFADAASIYAKIVTAAPNDGENWRHLADVLLRSNPQSDDDKAAAYQKATVAAYVAYRRGANSDDQADALVTLADAYGKRHIWRPALNALKLALSLRQDPKLQGLYQQLREKYGFRVTNYTIDSDTASPRVCFQFSEKLPQRADFSPFVAVKGEDKPAISVDDQQLCVDGLKHGDSYHVTLRQGLPSVVDEALLKSAEFDIYVRDRSPAVRLSGKAYVLPKTGQQGIPLVSVNTDKLSVTIYRIGDRNLLDEVLSDDFQSNLYSYSLDEIADTKGQKIWSGSLAVDKTLNQDVTTNFPVTEAVPDLMPGVYILAAQPASASSDDYSEEATQWFIVSDLGLTAYSGGDGLHAFVNSLATTDPIAGVELRLIARNNEVLATAKTDAQGAAHFDAGLTRGEGGMAPAMLVASEPGADYGFLSLQAPSFDLTDRGVDGRKVPGALDAFVFTERGVYRTGETVHVTALLRDAKGVAVTGTPLTFVVARPDDVQYRRVVVADEGLGGRHLDVPIVADAPSGTWHISVYADPKGRPIGETSFLVEDYVADRLEFDLDTKAKALAPHVPADISVNGRYLYGAPAGGLALEGEIHIEKADDRPGFKTYHFGLDDQAENSNAESQVVPLEGLPRTDAAGKATFPVTLRDVPDSTHPLKADVIIRMAEPGGRAVERDVELPVTPSKPMIGVKPLFDGTSLEDGATASFDVAMVGTDGKQLAAKGLTWQLLDVEEKYQWYKEDGSWQFEPVKITRRVANGTLDLDGSTPGRIAVPVSWGRYRLEVETADPSGPQTTFGFDAGWYGEATADTPDFLEISLDKDDYTAGDTMTVAVNARSAGKVTLAVIGNDRLLALKTQDVKVGMAKLPLTVGKDWGTGAYVLATLRRPLDVEEKRMPGRAVGVQWFGIDQAQHTIGVHLDLPQKIRPESTLTIPVKLSGLAPGEQARVEVSAVDVGILNLTNYEPPSATDYYLGQRQLSAEIRDLYGELIDGMQGAKGAIRSGGDSGGMAISGSPPSQAPLALYSGIVTVGQDGSAQISFPIPAFSGTVKVMAVAWSEDKVGQASGDVIVRDPVVVTASLPRFMLTGDQSTLTLDLDNVEGADGDYAIDVATDGPLKAGKAALTMALTQKSRKGLSVPITATGVGDGGVSVTVAGPKDFLLKRRYALSVKPANQILSRRTVTALQPGQSIAVSSALFADLVDGTGSVALSVTPSAALDVASLLQALDRYPLGCTEQIVSEAMPLIYLNDLATGQHQPEDTALNARIDKAIQTVLARQGPEGAFGLWSAGSEDAWLDAYVTDFLTRAKAQGYDVPDEPFKLALARLKNYVSTAPDVSKDGGVDLAYALYVLARNGTAPVGDLRYIADTKLDDLGTPTAKAQIGAALSMLGDRIRAEKAFQAALGSLPQEPVLETGRTDFGSPVRDAAAVVTLAAEGGAPQPILVSATSRIGKARDLVDDTSTQEDAWLVLAARALGAQPVSLLVNGDARDEPLYRTMKASELGQNPFTVTNTGDSPVDAVLTVSGAPVTPEPATDHGFHIERAFYTLTGQLADPSQAAQNQRFVVVLKVTEPQPQRARVALTDYLPAGFEIDNPQLVSSGDVKSFSWISGGVEPVHQEFRDDRFTAVFDRAPNDPSTFTVAYVVRAVTPGTYVLPQAHIEDMYRPDRYGETATESITITAAK
jgi:alpha-2-macroglobulin